MHCIKGLVFLAMTVGMAGCNSTQAPTAPQAQNLGGAADLPRRNSGVTTPGFKLPEGSGCSGQIARYQAVIENDQKTGHIGASVYGVIQGEIARASAACQAGRDGEAMAILRSSKSSHGYPG